MTDEREDTGLSWGVPPPASEIEIEVHPATDEEIAESEAEQAEIPFDEDDEE